jgi:hypothetical protein
LLAQSHAWDIVLIAVLATSSLVTQDKTADLRARFEKETDAVRKAKVVPRLADAEFRDIQASIDAGHLAEAADAAGHVAEEARTALEMLDARKRDPENFPDGYRQLQISARESVRRLDDILVGLSAEDLAPFRDVRNVLEEFDRQLMRRLFPHQPQSPAPATVKPRK